MTFAPPHAMGGVIVRIPPRLAECTELPVREHEVGDFFNPDVDYAAAEFCGCTGFVYVIVPDAEKVCKVGSAGMVAARMKELQAGAWQRLRCAAAFAVLNQPPHVLEFAAHAELKRMKVHRHSEWFNVTYDDAARVILRVANERAIRVDSVNLIRDRNRDDHRRRVANDEAERIMVLRRKLGMD